MSAKISPVWSGRGLQLERLTILEEDESVLRNKILELFRRLTVHGDDTLARLYQFIDLAQSIPCGMTTGVEILNIVSREKIGEAAVPTRAFQIASPHALDHFAVPPIRSHKLPEIAVHTDKHQKALLFHPVVEEMVHPGIGDYIPEIVAL